MMILQQKTLTTLQVYYYMPDYNSIIQEFVWQYTDRVPKFPRTHTFLNFWHEEIEAVIESVNLSYVDRKDNIRFVEEIFKV